MNKNSYVSRETFLEIFQQKLNENFLVLDEKMLNSFYVYYENLIKWNQSINLTRITAVDEIISRHFIDSLNFIKINFDVKGKTICDLGSGGGFPGIPLSIFYKETDFYLVEKVEKKASFLSYIKSLLNLEKTKIINNRIENIDIKFDVITMRAVNVEAGFLNELKNYLNENGKIILYLSPSQTLPKIFGNLSEYTFSVDNFSSKIVICSF